jgi:Rod binding domain-containing protein
VSTPDTLTAVAPSALGSTPVPVVNQASEPAAVRDGSPAVQQAYDEALSFETVLVNQLCKQLVTSAGLTGDGTGGSSSGSSDSPSDPAVSDFSSLLPGALASSIMSDGGLGLAAQLYPSLEGPAATGSGPTAPSIGSGGGTVSS